MAAEVVGVPVEGRAAVWGATVARETASVANAEEAEAATGLVAVATVAGKKAHTCNRKCSEH